MQKYSFKKGLGKGIVSLLAIGGGLVAFAGFSDITIVSLIEKYIFPFIGTLTIGGAITVAVNWAKFNLSKPKE